MVEYTIRPIGVVRKIDEGNYLELDPKYRNGLKQLEGYSHIIVLWWANKADSKADRNVIECNPPYAKKETVGVFACRSERRPNPIDITVTKIKEVNEYDGFIEVEEIDTYDGTPIIDIKPYIPCCDRLKKVEVPSWLPNWGQWAPDCGMPIYE